MRHGDELVGAVFGAEALLLGFRELRVADEETVVDAAGEVEGSIGLDGVTNGRERELGSSVCSEVGGKGAWAAHNEHVVGEQAVALRQIRLEGIH